MDRGTSTEDDGSINLHVLELRRRSEAAGSGATIFEPENSIGNRESSNSSSISPVIPAVLGPEKKLTLFALRLAVLEKAATSLGTLGFIWATVVLIGGFAITLDKTDFWFITIILLIQGARIFSRSHELEWQHQVTWSIADVEINSVRAIRSSSHHLIEAIKTIFRSISLGKRGRGTREITENGDRARNCQGKPTRTCASSDVPLLPYTQWFFRSRNISKLLYWLQLASATTCVVLSLMKMIKHNFGEVAKGDTDKRNRQEALSIFYSLALAEALLFLLEKAYWEWKVIYCKLLEEVNKECDLGTPGMVSIRRFFYDAYSKCINGSIFDGLKMDMVSFAVDLLDSNSPDEQLIGARILRQFAINARFSDNTLQKIGINISLIERLVEMLNWKDLKEEEIRRSAAEILSKLAGQKRNSLRVAGIPGAMESISSLLQTNRNSGGATDAIDEKNIILDHPHRGIWTFNHLGLLILKKLARDHDNCGKIGNTRGLLPKIIDFTHAGESLLRNEHATSSQIMTIKRSLQLVKMLARTTDTTGEHLRREISEVVFTISNIREILRYGENHPMLQKLGIEILTTLAIEEEATERIGGTGGILKELFNIFLRERMPENQNHVRIAAGETLAMLALDSSSNCHRILKLKVVDKLVAALGVSLIRINAARILTNLYAFSGADCVNQLRGVIAATPTVLKAIVSDEYKSQEVMIGLAAHVFRFMTRDESDIMFQRAGITEFDLANTLVQILKTYHHPPIKVPRIRRFSIELANWMMRDKATNIPIFKELGLEKQLDVVLETTVEIENFNIFSGVVGLSRHSISIHSLAETALKLLTEGKYHATTH